MVDINKHPLIRQAYELCHAIEACGASTELTSAAIKASSLMSAIEKEFADDPLDLGFEVKREDGDVLIRDSDDMEWTSGVVWARSAPETVVTMLADAYKVAAETGHHLDYIAYTLDLPGNSDVNVICKTIKDMWGKLYVAALRESAREARSTTIADAREYFKKHWGTSPLDDQELIKAVELSSPETIFKLMADFVREASPALAIFVQGLEKRVAKLELRNEFGHVKAPAAPKEK